MANESARPTATPSPYRRRALWIGLAVLAFVGLIIGTGAWLVNSESALSWTLARIPGLELQNPRGSIASGAFTADRVRISWKNGQAHAEIHQLEVRGLRWRRLSVSAPWSQLSADTVTARLVAIEPGPASPDPLREPSSLRLPLDIDLARVRVDELRVGTGEPALGLAARIHLGAQGGRQHRLTELQFEWDRVITTDGHLSLATDAPFAIEAQLTAKSRRGPPWQATLAARGPLARLDLQAALRGEALAGRSAPALDASVQLRPFEPWPLGTLALSTRELDLSALSSRAPATRLSGQAGITTTGPRAPVEATLDLSNALPGRVDQSRLPIRHAQATLRADRSRPGRWELPAFVLQLADAGGDAGRWQGQAVLDGDTATLDSRLSDIRLQRLDARAAAMRLSGPLAVTVKGLPIAPIAPIGAAASAPAASAGHQWDAVSAEFKGRFDGVLDRSPQPVTLAIEGSASARRVDLHRFEARAGDAAALGQATLLIQPGQRWQLLSKGRLDRLDPVPWVPGPAGSAWRRGPHRLNASWTLDLVLPDRSLRLPPVQWLQTLQGDGEIQLVDSRLAGVAMQGRLRLSRDATAPPAQRSHAQGELELGSNVLSVDGRGDPASQGDSDRWQVELRAPALAELAPLVALWPGMADWLPRKGGIDVRVNAAGRWPDLRTDGEASTEGLQVGELSIGRARTSWHMETTATQSLDVQADAALIAFGTQRIESLRGQVRGTLASHRLSVELTAPVRPPELLERALGLLSGKGTQVQLDGEGGWTADPAGGGIWRGKLQQLSAGVWGGTPDRAAGATWLSTGDLQGELRLDADGRLTSVSAPAGRATLAGGIVLRWNALRWRADPGHPDVTVQAEIDPFAVAPVMQRLARGGRDTTQWGGDLRMGARLDVRAGERFDAELRLRRQDGDLSYQDGGTPQWLGLSDVDFTLIAHDGEWRFTPLFIGRTLGTISGAITARTTPQARWPDRNTVLDGAVGVQVPNLGVWAGWLPPGWRIEGAMTTSARVAGTLGAPEYTGELRAVGVGLRNLLQGIALRDGELRIALKGETAQIERLSIRGGDGTLSATGRASLGRAPQATLEVTADKFRLLGRVDRQLVLSGKTALALQSDRLRLDGRLAVDSGLFDLSARDAPGLDDDVNVRRGGPDPAARPEPAPTPPMMRNAAVALDIDLGSNLRLRGRGLDTQLAGQLKLTAPGGRIAINGIVRAENGTYAAYGQKLDIERGLVAFAGPADGARLDILALRPNIDVRVGVAITGTALNPRVRLISEPEMSETDKLSWLVLGRGPDGLGRTDTALLQRAALALLAGEGEGPTDALVRAIGLDEISLRQSDGEVRETVISLGKQLSRRWYVGYERGVNATAGTWQLIYRVAQRFTLRAQSGLENSLDLIWTWRFGRP